MLWRYQRAALTAKKMLRVILTRLSLVVPTFIGITLLVFVLIRLIPGDPIEGQHRQAHAHAAVSTA